MPPRRPRNRGRVSDDGRGLPGGRGTHDADEGETPEARVQSAFSREATKAHTCPLRLRAHGAHRVARGRSGAPSRSRRFASHTRHSSFWTCCSPIGVLRSSPLRGALITTRPMVRLAATEEIHGGSVDGRAAARS